jgi:hypothetical protein
MPSLISESQKVMLTGALSNLFDTVARQIVIFKEPIQNIISSPSNPLFGFGGEQTSNTEITYTPVSGLFKGQIIYNNKECNEKSALFSIVFLFSFPTANLRVS